MVGRPGRDRKRTRAAERKLRARVATAVHDAVRSVLPDLAFHEIPKARVNWGWCTDVSEEVARLVWARHRLPGVVIQDDAEVCVQHDSMHDSGWTHQWCWVGGFHFDADAPFGVRRWTDLPHFLRWKGPDPIYGGEHIEIIPALTFGQEQARLYASARALKDLGHKLEQPGALA